LGVISVQHSLVLSHELLVAPLIGRQINSNIIYLKQEYHAKWATCWNS